MERLNTIASVGPSSLATMADFNTVVLCNFVFVSVLRGKNTLRTLIGYCLFLYGLHPYGGIIQSSAVSGRSYTHLDQGPAAIPSSPNTPGKNRVHFRSSFNGIWGTSLVAFICCDAVSGLLPHPKMDEV